MDPPLVHQHHYCVVQTHEAGRSVLTTVPHQWINGKFLLWPSKNAESLRKDISSKAASTWAKIPCKIKRRFIPTFIEAEQEVAEMSGVNTDSDISQVPVVNRSRKKARKVETQQMNFNSYFTTTAPVPNQTNDNTSPTNSASLPLAPEVILIETRDNMVMQPPTVVASTQQMSWKGNDALQQVQITDQPQTEAAQQQGGEVSNVCDYVLNLNQDTYDNDRMKQEIFEKIEAAKSEIVDTITKNVKDLLAKSISAIKCDFDAKLELAHQCKSSSTSSEVPRFSFSPMSTIEQLQELEENLEDDEYARKLMKHMRQLIGTTGDQFNGQNVCYELVDKFFERQLLTKCSWTGQSRSGTQKYAIQNCKNLLNLIFSIVKSVNEHFSEKALFDFFKSITRNSKRRSESKQLRQSTVKRRCRKNTGALQDQYDAELHNLFVNRAVVPNRSTILLSQPDVLEPGHASDTEEDRSAISQTLSAAESNCELDQNAMTMNQTVRSSNQNRAANFKLRLIPTMHKKRGPSMTLDESSSSDDTEQ